MTVNTHGIHSRAVYILEKGMHASMKDVHDYEKTLRTSFPFFTDVRQTFPNSVAYFYQGVHVFTP